MKALVASSLATFLTCVPFLSLLVPFHIPITRTPILTTPLPFVCIYASHLFNTCACLRIWIWKPPNFSNYKPNSMIILHTLICHSSRVLRASVAQRGAHKWLDHHLTPHLRSSMVGRVARNTWCVCSQNPLIHRHVQIKWRLVVIPRDDVCTVDHAPLMNSNDHFLSQNHLTRKQWTFYT